MLTGKTQAAGDTRVGAKELTNNYADRLHAKHLHIRGVHRKAVRHRSVVQSFIKQQDQAKQATEAIAKARYEARQDTEKLQVTISDIRQVYLHTQTKVHPAVAQEDAPVAQATQGFAP